MARGGPLAHVRREEPAIGASLRALGLTLSLVAARLWLSALTWVFVAWMPSVCALTGVFRLWRRGVCAHGEDGVGGDGGADRVFVTAWVAGHRAHWVGA
jgi:hypothetical protein